MKQMKVREAIEMLDEIINILPVSKDPEHQDKRYIAIRMGQEALTKVAEILENSEFNYGGK